MLDKNTLLNVDKNILVELLYEVSDDFADKEIECKLLRLQLASKQSNQGNSGETAQSQVDESPLDDEIPY